MIFNLENRLTFAQLYKSIVVIGFPLIKANNLQYDRLQNIRTVQKEPWCRS